MTRQERLWVQECERLEAMDRRELARSKRQEPGQETVVVLIGAKAHSLRDIMQVVAIEHARS